MKVKKEYNIIANENNININKMVIMIKYHININHYKIQ